MERAKAYDTNIPASMATVSDAKPFQRPDRARPRIALVLGGGGARGLAHIGVLKVLCSASIPVDFVTGASMGAVIGGAFAAGFPVEEMEQIALKVGIKKMLSWADFIWPRRGLVAGDRVEKNCEDVTFGKNFDELDIPSTFVATDIDTGEEVRLSSGKVSRALRASTAVPGIFNPVDMNGRRLVDGSISASLPIQAARGMGGDVIIASDVRSDVDATEKLLRIKRWWNNKKNSRKVSYLALSGGTIIRFVEPILPESVCYVARTLEFCTKNMDNVEISEQYPGASVDMSPIVSIKPKVSHIKWFQFYKARECIEAGEEAAREALKNLERIL
ncbi:MAG: patatin-like phospholipase family protein [Tepidanaerobacteraceae bacterium]|jgi:NTE family protein|nr:patatin-like phospholipase family protein [Tepidanaerobacteraceae bacterium]